MKATHAMILTLGLLGCATLAASAGEPKGKVAFDVYAGGYFVRNDAPIAGNPAFLVLPSKKSFDGVFGFGFVMGAKPKLVDNKLFDANLIAVVVKEGNAPTTYEVQKVEREKGRLVVHYKATQKQATTARFRSPLILSVPRGDYAEIAFIENGKEVGKAAVKK